jgi:8-oxo-dGTP diphosphatase
MILGTLCYIQKDHRILLLHRNKKADDPMGGYWIGLGGKVEIETGESPHDCIVREVYEESGLHVEPTLRGIVTFRHVEQNIEDWYAYIFAAKDYSGSLNQTREGELEWIENSKLNTINLPEGDKLLLKWLQTTDNVFSATLEYREKQLSHHTVVFY